MTDAIAGSDRQAIEPGVPRVRITQRAQVPPGHQQCVLDGILGAVGIAKDEAGDAIQPAERCLHQLREGIEVPVPGQLDERSLHGRHPVGAKHPFALS